MWRWHTAESSKMSSWVRTILTKGFLRSAASLPRYYSASDYRLASQNYFNVFGLSPAYDLSPDDLTTKYRDLLRKSHPDKFHQKSDAERANSEEQSRIINQAYQTLRNPYRRGLYLLELKNSPVQESQLDLTSDVLSEVYETNEELADVEDAEKLQKIKERNDAKIANLVSQVATAFAEDRIEDAKKDISRMKYYITIAEKIKLIELELGVMR